MYNNLKIFILGMAKSGYGAAKLLSKYENKILITDIKEQNENDVNELKNLGIEYVITDNPALLLDNTYDLLIKNPGIHMDHECVIKAHELNIKVVNEVEVAYHFLNKNIDIIGVTGSNGKTTTVTIINEIFKCANISVKMCGNIGIPLSLLVNDIKENDILLMEISDHQLIDMYDFKTKISILTNISPTHLDLHKTYDHYKKTKQKIFNNHDNNSLAILNKDNEDVLDISKDIVSKKLYFSSTNKSNVYLKDNGIYYFDQLIISYDEIKVKGIHNYENIMAAIMVVKQYNVSNEIIKNVLGKFNGVEHRIEYVRNHNGITYYNDSKSTNPKATITAIRSFDTSIILILGGYDRSEDFNALKDDLKNIKAIIAYGQSREKISEFANKYNIPCTSVEKIKEVINASLKYTVENDVVLLSPGCASWDQYDHFEERGLEFKQIVNEL